MPQSLSNILLHLVFSVKNREPLIFPELESELYAYIAAIHKNMACHLLKIGGTENHLHILCRLKRVVTVGEQTIGRSEKEFLEMDQRQGRTAGGFCLAGRIWRLLIGMSNVEALEKYIARQKEHHRQRTFEDEYRTLLKKYRVEWDEKYVWD